jgi:hypothetical protein
MRLLGCCLHRARASDISTRNESQSTHRRGISTALQRVRKRLGSNLTAAFFSSRYVKNFTTRASGVWHRAIVLSGGYDRRLFSTKTTRRVRHSNDARALAGAHRFAAHSLSSMSSRADVATAPICHTRFVRLTPFVQNCSCVDSVRELGAAPSSKVPLHTTSWGEEAPAHANAISGQTCEVPHTHGLRSVVPGTCA